MMDPEANSKVSAIISELRDVNKDRRRTAVMKLGMVGGDQAVRTLIGIVENSQEDLIVRGRAALMLGKLKDDRAVPHLIRALQAPGFVTPFNAAQALGKIGDPRAIDALLRFADSSNDKTRAAAEEALRQLGYEVEAAFGEHDVPLEQIAGSVGRYKDFTASFLPRKSGMKERWSRVYALANSLEGPPPIELYKVGDVYFVRDGNHRVSVARQLGAKTIQAHVIEMPTTIPLRPGMSDQELEAAEAYANFLDETSLSRAVPEHESIELTEPTRYHELMGHIFLHERVMEQLEGHALTTEEATADWYFTMYKPAIALIRKYDVLDLAKGKPGARTEGDLFLWLMNNLLDLRHQYGDDAPVQSISGAIKSYLEEERVRVPEALASESDQSLLLTRTQAMKAVRAKRQQRQEMEDRSETDAQIS